MPSKSDESAVCSTFISHFSASLNMNATFTFPNDRVTFVFDKNQSTNNTSSSLSNYTNVDNSAFQASLTWSVLPVVALFALLTGAILNVTVLGIFLTRRKLRSSFGVYLMNVLIIDNILVFIHGPFNIIDKYSTSWTLGWKMCAFQSYMGYTYQNLIIVAHFLIALNRVWAVVFPFSYRTHHTKKVAVMLCFSAWLVLNICNIPVALTVTVLTLGATNGSLVCDIDTATLGSWNYISQLLMFDTPILFVILAYPVVCHMSFFADRKKRVRANVVGQSQLATIAPTVANTVNRPAGDDAESGGEGGQVRGKAFLCGRKLNGSVTGFVTLTLMTSSVVICRRRPTIRGCCSTIPVHLASTSLRMFWND